MIEQASLNPGRGDELRKNSDVRKLVEELSPKTA
jgi:hypothetical protein